MVEVRPFTLENLLWLCLKHLFAVTEGQRTVEMDVAEVDDRTTLDLRCGQGLPITMITARVEAEAQPLLASLRAEINGDEPGGLLRLTLPRR